MQKHQNWIQDVQKEHRAHIVEDVSRFKSELFKVFAERLRGWNVEKCMDMVPKVVYLERGYLRDTAKEFGGVNWQNYMAQGKHDEQLLCIHHGPELIERRGQDKVEGKVCAKSSF